MENFSASTAASADLSEMSGLSRRALRHLIVRHDLPVGSRILDVGCGLGRLVRFLHQLGFDATGIDDNQQSIRAARQLAPFLDLRHGAADELAQSGQNAFDVVLVRDFSGYDDNLFSARSLETTANLISCLRPGRLLVFLARTGRAGLELPAAHSLGCFDAHLGAFPGRAETAVLPDSYAAPGTWTSLLAGRRPTGYLTATYELPAQPRSRDEWLEMAASAARRLRATCCQSQQAARPAA